MDGRSSVMRRWTKFKPAPTCAERGFWQIMLTVNNYFGVLQAVIHNLGIGILPDYVTRDFEGVVRVLDDIESVEVPVYLAYPEELRQSKRIEAFKEFVQDEIIEHRKNFGKTI